ncbi:MAG: hypothetical protein HY077_18285 [Elusimicrobia bacterium]|nr:hypothetical protein [Elusimicrobiota bacterium]
MRKKNAVKPRRMRKPPRGRDLKPLELAPLSRPRHHLPEIRYRRVWP